MQCCRRCFTDRFIDQLISANSNLSGTCNYCSSDNVDLYPTKGLADEFESLVDLYMESGEGGAEPLSELIQRHWRICSHYNYKELLNDILSELEIAPSSTYKLRREPDHSLVEQWRTFTEELRHRNRYFPSSRPDEELLALLLANLVTPMGPKSVVYRARINNGEESFTPDKLKKPPPLVATAGRANPLGIAYFYTASHEATAVAEVRPQPGDTVTVAQFEAREELRLIDLRDPYRTFTPFGHEGDLERILLQGLPLLQHLGEELTKPIPRGQQSELDYLASQYLCELIKWLESDGVIYDSSLTDGSNYATFEDTCFGYNSCRELIIENVDVRSREKE